MDGCFLILAITDNRKSNGAGNETRTRDPDLGKVVLYQLSYSRARPRIIRVGAHMATRVHRSVRRTGHAARRYTYADQIVSAAATPSSTSPT